MFAMLITDAFQDTDDTGIYRTDGEVFNLKCLRSKTKVTLILISYSYTICERLCHHGTGTFVSIYRSLWIAFLPVLPNVLSYDQFDEDGSYAVISARFRAFKIVNDTALNIVDKFCYLCRVL